MEISRFSLLSSGHIAVAVVQAATTRPLPGLTLRGAPDTTGTAALVCGWLTLFSIVAIPQQPSPSFYEKMQSRRAIAATVLEVPMAADGDIFLTRADFAVRAAQAICCADYVRYSERRDIAQVLELVTKKQTLGTWSQ